jgi:rSAM/selenodomain-associated transferase 2
MDDDSSFILPPSSFSPMISIIIPCWNDANALQECLSRVAPIAGDHEIIVADASTTTDCAAIAASFPAVRLIRCDRPNRGRQMNAGAAAATGDVLLFQHTDTELSADHLSAVERAIAADPQIIGGAFHRKFDPRHRSRQWLVPIVRRWQSWRQNFYGDQSIFVRRAHFQSMGGYAEIALMEDIEFSARLKRSGKVIVLDPPMLSSARRHRRHGKLLVTLENFALIALFKLGISPDRLHRWYYRKARKLASNGEASAIGAPQIAPET